MKLIKKLHQAKYATELAKLIVEAREIKNPFVYIRANNFKSKVAYAVITGKVGIDFYKRMFEPEEAKDYNHFLDYWRDIANKTK